jgi:hypothetical protein
VPIKPFEVAPQIKNVPARSQKSRLPKRDTHHSGLGDAIGTGGGFATKRCQADITGVGAYKKYNRDQQNNRHSRQQQ